MALYALGHCYERLEKEAQAIEFYQDCLKFKNYLQLPRYRLAAIYFKNAQFEKTINEYDLLRQEYPDDISTLVSLGYLHIAAADYKQAEESFNKAILIHPDNFHFEGRQIEQLLRDGQVQEALEQVDDLLIEQPEEAGLLVKRGDILTMLGNNTDALLMYERAILFCPDFLEASIKLGTQYLQMGQNRPAAQQFNMAIEINDRIVDSYIGLAIAQKAVHNKEQALTTLSLAAAIQPNSSLLFAEAANLQFLLDSGQVYKSDSEKDSGQLLENAIVAHKQQIALEPNNPDLHYRFGMLMMNVSRMNEALNAFQKVLQINPTYYRAKNKLAICLYETNQHQAALEQLSCSESINKETIELHYKVALLYCDRIKFASSLINLEQHMLNIFAETDATVNISIALQNLGLMDRAAAMWDNLSTTSNQFKNTDKLF